MKKRSLLWEPQYYEEMKRRAETDFHLAEIIGAITEKAETALDLWEVDESHADAKKTTHGNYYDASIPMRDNAAALGMAYRLTGDKRYGEKLKKLLLLYCGYKKWCGGGWWANSELNTSNFAFGIAAAYDFLKDELSEERDFVVQALLNKAIKPIYKDWLDDGTRVHALDTMGHNWWLIIVSQGGLAALMIADELPEAEEYAHKAAKAAEQWFTYAGNAFCVKPVNADRNGGYYEGVAYLDYMLSEYMAFRNLYIKRYGAMPWNDRVVLNRYADFIMQSYYPSTDGGFHINFGDCANDNGLKSVSMLLGGGVERSDLRWYRKHGVFHTDIWDFLYYDSIFGGEISMPGKLGQSYPDMGWAMVRNSYNDNATLLGVKCGDTWNHAHADSGSFVLFHNGKREAADSGTCVYDLDEYLDYYCASLAHNVVLCNGKGQEREDSWNHVRNRGRIIGFEDGEVVKSISVDATGPMARYFRRHIRHFVWMDGVLLIYDDIQAYEKSSVQWLLHRDEDAEIPFSILSPKVLKVIKDGKKPSQPQTIQKYESYETETDDSGRVKFVSVFDLDGAGEIVLDEIGNFFKISWKNTVLYINKTSDGSLMHRNCIENIDGYQTDAVIFAKSNRGYFILNGSMLRRNGISISENLVYQTGSIDSKEEETEQRGRERQDI